MNSRDDQSTRMGTTRSVTSAGRKKRNKDGDKFDVDRDRSAAIQVRAAMNRFSLLDESESSDFDYDPESSSDDGSFGSYSDVDSTSTSSSSANFEDAEEYNDILGNPELDVNSDL